MKIRSSTKIGIGFVLLAALTVSGYRFAMDQAVRNEHFDPPVPGEVNLLGVDAGAGYRILVANQMAQLVQSSNEFQGKEGGDAGATEGAIKKRIPIREMLGVLKGDQKSAGEFIMRMNDLSDSDFPPLAPVWKSTDIETALSKPGKLREKLIRDLNVELDGTPLSKLRYTSLENGILIECPVQLHVAIQGKPQVVTGYVMQAYKPRLIKAVETRYADKANLTRAMQAGYYQEEATKAMTDGGKEDVKRSITSLIAPTTLSQLAEAPEHVLQSATVVVNESHITKAERNEYDSPNGKRYDLTIHMTDEGRRRLHKYSHDRVGSQLLVITDGIAIAAPRIGHELAQGELTITQMQDRVLVDDAVRILNEKAKSQ